MPSLKGKIRKLTASKISTVDNAEIFAWDKWLRMPVSEIWEVKPLFSRLGKTEDIVLSISPPESSGFKCSIAKVKTYKSSKKISSFKSRSNMVFFQFGKTTSHNISIKFKHELEEIFSAVVISRQGDVQLKTEGPQNKPAAVQLSPSITDIPFQLSYMHSTGDGKISSTEDVDFGFGNFQAVNYETNLSVEDSKEINYNIELPDVIDYLSRLLPKIYKISLLSTFEEMIAGVDSFLIKIDLLDSLPATYQSSFNNISVPDFYFSSLKNEMISTVDKKIYIEKLSPLNVHFDKIYFPEMLSDNKAASSDLSPQFYFTLGVKGKDIFTYAVGNADHLLQPKSKKASIKIKAPAAAPVIKQPTPGRDKTQLSGVKIIDNWIDLDKEQKLEYEQELFHAQSQIWDIYQTGNPYRLQAKVFTLIHQLKQILNFSSKGNSSIKSRLLLSQLKTLQSSGEKAIIFSQYDKFGTQKLSDILNAAGIKFVSCLPGAFQNELDDNVKKFEKDSSITALLMAAKAVPPKIHLKAFNAAIHFDQWWVPVSQWQLEDKIINGNDSAVRIVNYFTKDTIDETIKAKLEQHGLLNKNMVEFVGADSFSKLLTENDWFDIFKLQPEKKNKEIQEKISPGDFLKLSDEIIMEKTALLLGSIGFKNISGWSRSEKDYSIIKGSYLKKGQPHEMTGLYFHDMAVPEENSLNEIIDSEAKAKDEKLFIFCPYKKFKSIQPPVRESASIVDSSALFNYLRIFRII